MRKLRYPLRIFTLLQFLLVFTGLLHSPAEPCLPGAQAIPVDGYRLQQISSVKVVDPLDHHQGTGPFKNSIGHHNDRSSATTDLPSVVSDDGQPRPSFAASPSGPLPFKLSGTTIQRLRPVVHETNKGILLTNGEQIKLYPLKESDLTPSGGYYVIQSKLNSTTNGWNRPLISDVGYVFDNRFCTSPNHTWIPKRNCLVIFWLDKKNKLFRYGSFMFTHPSRIELLSSKFNANGNLKSLSDKNKKTLLLDEFPPIDLCKRARELDYLLSDCAVSSMTIDRSKLELHVSLNVSATITSANSSQAKKYVTATMSAYIGKTLLDFQNIDISSNSKKNDIPDAIAMTENNLRCKYFWMNANYELYSSNLAGQDVQLIEKLSSKPAIRMLGEIHSYRDILFFSDMASKSIMSYNLTHRADINRQTKPRESRGRKKFEMVEKFESTHHVLLVETSTINKFSIMDLKEVGPWRTESVCKMQQAKGFEEPRVIDDNLSEHLRRQKLNLDYEQHLLEDIMQITLIVLSILLIIFIVTDKTRIKQVKPDRETFFNNNNVEP